MPGSVCLLQAECPPYRSLQLEGVEKALVGKTNTGHAVFLLYPDFFFLSRVSCRSGGSHTHYVSEDDLELLIYLLSVGISGMCHCLPSDDDHRDI